MSSMKAIDSEYILRKIIAYLDSEDFRILMLCNWKCYWSCTPNLLYNVEYRRETPCMVEIFKRKPSAMCDTIECFKINTRKIPCNKFYQDAIAWNRMLKLFLFESIGNNVIYLWLHIHNELDVPGFLKILPSLPNMTHLTMHLPYNTGDDCDLSTLGNLQYLSVVVSGKFKLLNNLHVPLNIKHLVVESDHIRNIIVNSSTIQDSIVDLRPLLFLESFSLDVIFRKKRTLLLPYSLRSLKVLAFTPDMVIVPNTGLSHLSICGSSMMHDNCFFDQTSSRSVVVPVAPFNLAHYDVIEFKREWQVISYLTIGTILCNELILSLDDMTELKGVNIDIDDSDDEYEFIMCMDIKKFKTLKVNNSDSCSSDLSNMVPDLQSHLYTFDSLTEENIYQRFVKPPKLSRDNYWSILELSDVSCKGNFEVHGLVPRKVTVNGGNAEFFY